MSIPDKRAALEMHRLNPEDREWVLDRLPPAEQARVRPLLAELDAMNVRFDTEGDTNGIDDQPHHRSTADSESMVPEVSARSLVHDASAIDVLHVLSEEPAWVARALLAIDDWPWSASVRRVLTQRGALREPSMTRQASPLPSGLSTALLSLVAERLSTAASERTNGHANGHRNGVNGSGIGSWRSMWPKVRQWLP